MSNKWTAAQRKKFIATMKQRKHADYIPYTTNVGLGKTMQIISEKQPSLLAQFLRIVEKLI